MTSRGPNPAHPAHLCPCCTLTFPVRETFLEQPNVLEFALQSLPKSTVGVSTMKVHGEGEARTSLYDERDEITTASGAARYWRWAQRSSLARARRLQSCSSASPIRCCLPGCSISAPASAWRSRRRWAVRLALRVPKRRYAHATCHGLARSYYSAAFSARPCSCRVSRSHPQRPAPSCSTPRVLPRWR